MAHSRYTGPGPGTGIGTMGYYILCRTVHTAPEPGTGPDPLSPIVPVTFPVPVPFPFSCSVKCTITEVTKMLPFNVFLRQVLWLSRILLYIMTSVIIAQIFCKLLWRQTKFTRQLSCKTNIVFSVFDDGSPDFWKRNKNTYQYCVAFHLIMLCDLTVTSGR